MMKIRWFPILFVAFITLAGCATTPPIRTDLTSIQQNPGEYRNKKVEVTAPVLQNPPPIGSSYLTWNFALGSSETDIIRVTKAGYNPATIVRAYTLVEEARRAGQPVTITGKLRVGPYRALRSGMEIDLDTVGYGEIVIDTNRGPYVNGYYPYPPPFFWDYPFYPYGFGAFGGFGDYDNYNGFEGFGGEE